jgi:hypothetical protein
MFVCRWFLFGSQPEEVCCIVNDSALDSDGHEGEKFYFFSLYGRFRRGERMNPGAGPVCPVRSKRFSAKTHFELFTRRRCTKQNRPCNTVVTSFSLSCATADEPQRDGMRHNICRCWQRIVWFHAPPASPLRPRRCQTTCSGRTPFPLLPDGIS